MAWSRLRARWPNGTTLKVLSASLIAGSLLTTALAFGAGWMLSGAALQPIHRITQTAQQIGRERDLTARVEHRGPGMPAELRERIFDRFYRGDESRSSPGFGLGLPISTALTDTMPHRTAHL